MKIGFIGVGNMGGAIVKAIVKTEPHALYLSNYNQRKAKALKKESPTIQVVTNEVIAQQCDVIFLGVKPYLIKEMMTELCPLAKEQTLWVTMAAGVTTEQLVKASGNNQLKLIRMMPNTPIEIGHGMTTYTYSNQLSSEAVDTFKAIMKKTGKLLYVPENKMDAATAIAGCGPAFIYQLIEAFSDAGVREGLSRQESIVLATNMIKGASQMVLETGKHPGQLKDEVTSPGGSTIEGVISLEQSGLRSSIIEAVHQSYLKTKALKDEVSYGKK